MIRLFGSQSARPLVARCAIAASSHTRHMGIMTSNLTSEDIEQDAWNAHTSRLETRYHSQEAPAPALAKTNHSSASLNLTATKVPLTLQSLRVRVPVKSYTTYDDAAPADVARESEGLSVLRSLANRSETARAVCSQPSFADLREGESDGWERRVSDVEAQMIDQKTWSHAEEKIASNPVINRLSDEVDSVRREIEMKLQQEITTLAQEEHPTTETATNVMEVKITLQMDSGGVGTQASSRTTLVVAEVHETKWIV